MDVLLDLNIISIIFRIPSMKVSDTSLLYSKINHMWGGMAWCISDVCHPI